MSGNGVLIGMAAIITAKVLMKIQQALQAERIACCAAVRGATVPVPCAVRIAAAAIRAVTTSISGFVASVSFNLVT